MLSRSERIRDPFVAAGLGVAAAIAPAAGAPPASAAGWSEWDVPTSGTANGADMIAAAPDGSVWFTEGTTAQVGRITPGGTITQHAVPADPVYPVFTPGPVGALWLHTDSGATRAVEQADGDALDEQTTLAAALPAGHGAVSGT